VDLNTGAFNLIRTTPSLMWLPLHEESPLRWKLHGPFAVSTVFLQTRLRSSH